MNVFYEIKTRFFKVFTALVSCLVVAYFLVHAVKGKQDGQRLQSELRELKAEYERIDAERDVAERQAYLLRPENVNPDLADEKARGILGVIHPDEVLLEVKQAED